jgi:hypothetical protein
MMNKKLDKKYIVKAALWLRYCEMHREICDIPACELCAQLGNFQRLDLKEYLGDSELMQEIEQSFYLQEGAGA